MQSKKSFVDNYLNVDYLVELQNHPNFTLYAALLASLIVLFTIVILRLFSKSKSGKHVLIVGLSDAGKTLLFTRLVCERFVKTVTSMNVNEAEFSVNNKNVPIVDLPGYERLREKFWDDFKFGARGVIFVVDSSQFMANMRDVAEFLYNVLADPIISRGKTPLLIACNKQDAPKAKSSKVIQSQLEKEINAIRETKKSALSFTDDSNVSQKLIGDCNKEFQFSDLKLKLDFVDCSALGNEEGDADLNQVYSETIKFVPIPCRVTEEQDWRAARNEEVNCHVAPIGRNPLRCSDSKSVRITEARNTEVSLYICNYGEISLSRPPSMQKISVLKWKWCQIEGFLEYAYFNKSLMEICIYGYSCFTEFSENCEISLKLTL